MGRRVLPLTLDTLDRLPSPCRRCVFWELDPLGQVWAEKSGDVGLEKEAWLSATLLEWGRCGVLVEQDGETAGYALFAPGARVPRSTSFPSSPASADAVLLMALRVEQRWSGQGIARILVQEVAREAVQRGLRAVEAFGDREHPGTPGGCVLPAPFLDAVGFATVRPHPRWPRMRLDLRSTNWLGDIEVAVERLFSSLRAEAGLRPA